MFFSTDYYATSNVNLRPNTSAVSGGAQHVANPLASAQGAPVVPQGTIQQPTQQAQPLSTMGIPLSQAGTLLLIHYFIQTNFYHLFTMTHFTIIYLALNCNFKISK